MQNIDQSFTLFADIKLNPDILDTGFINIVILVAFLIYALKEPIQEILEERRKNIDQEIRNANSRLKEAEKRLKEAQKQYQQVQIAKKEIEKRFLNIRKASLDQLKNLARKDLEIMFAKAHQAYSVKSEEIVEEITLDINGRVYDELVIIMKDYFKSDKNIREYMDRTLDKLSKEFNEGDF